MAGIDRLSQDVYKRESVRRFVDRLSTQQEQYGPLLLQLMSDVGAMDDFPRLEWLEDADVKVAQARQAVDRLRTYIKPYETQIAEQLEAQARIAAARNQRELRQATSEAQIAEQLEAQARIAAARNQRELRQATSEALQRARSDYFTLFSLEDAQRRGFEFEPWLRALFDLFDLDPRGSFRASGDQIDGGFTLDGTHFLLEARWRKHLATRDDLGAFKSKVDDKVENTLGLFISVAGFEPSAVSRHSQRGSPLILVDGGDILAVLDERIDLRDLLRRKLRHAAMTGEIFIPVTKVIT